MSVDVTKMPKLGFGMMRLPEKDGELDLEQICKMVDAYLASGMNYFDTAYIYPGSEAALGKFLAKGCRDKVYIATKLPHYIVKSLEDADRIFEEELRRLQTDHIDYYLMHMLTDIGGWERMCALGIRNWIRRRKEAGQIRQIGFSYHGGTPGFLKILEAYDWEFCQIQFNYMDEQSQAGRKGLRRAAELGSPVVIMEPLRGGRLAGGLPAGAAKIFEQAEPRRSPAEWALRWIWNHPEVSVVLSGMNDMAQVRENAGIASAAEADTLTQAELDVFDQVRQEISRVTKVGCTGCGYCMPCPQGVDIPVFVKNPVNPDLELWIGALERINNAGLKRLAAIHRGFSSYDKKLYRNLPQWHIPIELRRRIPNLPIMCDPSHIGGKRELIAPLCQQAMDLGFNGLIIESHCNPDCAWSDASQQVTPDVLDYILNLLVIRKETQTTENLSELRKQIDECDNNLMQELAKRMRVAREIGTFKKEHDMTILQTGRYNEILDKRGSQGVLLGVDSEFIKKVFELIHEESVRQQMEIINK